MLNGALSITGRPIYVHCPSPAALYSCVTMYYPSVADLYSGNWRWHATVYGSGDLRLHVTILGLPQQISAYDHSRVPATSGGILSF